MNLIIYCAECVNFSIYRNTVQRKDLLIKLFNEQHYNIWNTLLKMNKSTVQILLGCRLGHSYTIGLEYFEDYSVSKTCKYTFRVQNNVGRA